MRRKTVKALVKYLAYQNSGIVRRLVHGKPAQGEMVDTAYYAPQPMGRYMLVEC